MTESVARLRGDQLTLGYGSYTVAKTLTFRFQTAILPPLSALMAAANRLCYVR